MDKKTSIISKQIARFRGWVQAAATLLTNIHLPNFFNGMCSRFELLLMPCRFRSLSHRCFSGSGWVFKIQIFLLHHGIYHLTWCNLRSIYMRFPLSLRMVPGSAAQDTRQKVLYTKAETTALSEIPDSSGIRNPFANVGHQFDWNGRSLLLQIHMPSGCIGRCHPTFSWQCSYPVGTWQTIYF